MSKDMSLIYPRVKEFIAGLSNPEQTFLSDRIPNIDYPFWYELEYFLSNKDRFGNFQLILDRLAVEVPIDIEPARASEKWIQFRATQFEVAVIYLIEQYFSAKVVEIIQVNSKARTPDFSVQLSQREYRLEAKAQSGQQRGDKHPRSDDPILFDPKDETDLRSWLFEAKLSSRDKEPMKPKAVDADEQGADILVCQTDYVAIQSDIMSKVSVLCPKSKFLQKLTVGHCETPITLNFFRASYPCERQLNNLKEIWLYNLAHLDRFIVLSGEETLLLNHLRCAR